MSHLKPIAALHTHKYNFFLLVKYKPRALKQKSKGLSANFFTFKLFLKKSLKLVSRRDDTYIYIYRYHLFFLVIAIY